MSVALVIQHAKRMRRIILSSSVCLALLYFSTLSLSHTRHDFGGKKVIEHELYVLIFSKTSVWNISHCKSSARWHNYTLVFMYGTRYSCHILIEPEFFWTNFLKILKYQVPWKYVHWEPSCSIRTDRQTNTQRTNSRISQFCEDA